LSYQIVLLPGLSIKGDICDWIRDGGNAKDLVTSAKEPKELFGLSPNAHPNAQAWKR